MISRASFGRISAIARADLYDRSRKLGTMLTLLIIAAGVYLIIPDLSTGNALLMIDNKRVIYNSAAVALGTGMFCSIFLVMVGYYLVSNSIRRDLVSRTGYLIASSPVTNLEYLVAKFLGNAATLSVFTLACMVSSIVMFFIRGERPLEPLVFPVMYAWLAFPAIIFASSIAVAFEAFPPFSGRFGDVLYFFLWAMITAVPTGFIENGIIPSWAHAIDYTGILSVITSMRDTYHTNQISIGMSAFKPGQPPLFFGGLPYTASDFAARISTAFIPAAIILVAQFWFHRFNPVRIKGALQQGKTSFFGKITRLLKPVTRIIPALRGNTPGSSVAADVYLTLIMSPLTIIAIVVCAILSLTLPAAGVREGLLPVVIAIASVAAADIVPRDVRSRTAGFLFTAPRIRQQYIVLKFASALVLMGLFTLPPAIRLFSVSLPSFFSLVIGTFMLTSAAVSMGAGTGSPKLFVASLLMFLYIALNARTEPWMDFAGFNGKATAEVQIFYTAAGLLMLGIAVMRHRSRLRKN